MNYILSQLNPSIRIYSIPVLISYRNCGTLICFVFRPRWCDHFNNILAKNANYEALYSEIFSSLLDTLFSDTLSLSVWGIIRKYYLQRKFMYHLTSSAVIKNARSFASITPYIFMAEGGVLVCSEQNMYNLRWSFFFLMICVFCLSCFQSNRLKALCLFLWFLICYLQEVCKMWLM